MSTAFKPLELPPGVKALATKKAASTNYSEVNAVRWIEGQLAPIGGQSKYSFTFASRCKAVHGWYDLGQVWNVAYLCEAHLYVDRGGQLIDISPTVPIVPPQAPSVGGYGDGAYGTGPPDTYGTPRTIGTDAAIDRVPDAFSLGNFGAVLLAMTSADGRLLFWDPASTLPAGFRTTLAAASAILTTSPNITMPTNPGNVTAGMGVYDITTSKPIGTVLTYVGTALVLTANAQNAGASGDTLQFSGNIASVVTPAVGSTVPHGRCFVVTPERFVQIFGSTQDGTAGAGSGGSFRRFAWCEQEDYTNWSYTDLTTQAGFIDVEPASPIITAVATRSGTLFWTAKKTYRSRYLGTPYVYNIDELNDATTPWSPQSVVTTSSMVLWFSQQGPYSYDGTSVLPVQCMVRAWIDDDIDLLQVREQACAIHVAPFNEFWWCYPQGSLSNPDGFNTRVAIYNYKEGWWSQARCARSAGVTASYTAHTIMANGLVSYQHENGFTYWDCELPWIETFDLNVGGGRLITVKQMMPDIEGALNGVLYSLFYRNSRTTGLVEQRSPQKQVRSNGYVDFRTTGRDLRLRIDLASPPGMIIDGVASDGSVRPVTVGAHLIDYALRGDR